MVSLLRLDKFLADVGVGTRSEVKKLLKQGLVTINGQTVRDSSTKVNPETDKVTFKGQELLYQEFRYYMLNKPAGCVSATKDGLSQTVIEFLKGEPTRDLFPVGRLDKDTEGLLLITNDGMLAHNLLSPKKHVDKTYIAYVNKPLDDEQLGLFKTGLDIGDETPTLPAEIDEASEQDITKNLEKASISKDIISYSAVYNVVLKEGRYHQIKRMFEHFNSTVVYLKRLSMGNLKLDSQLLPGSYRPLTLEEISSLKN
ncbi:MAG: rRNA pseudouridine synthase [Candidatus Riflebacteria bacterium]|nr:rRNA pseudouridine synthase [Candidatus Riflebacteria bacterium]